MPSMMNSLHPLPLFSLFPQNLPYLPIGSTLQNPQPATNYNLQVRNSAPPQQIYQKNENININLKHHLQVVPPFSGERTSTIGVNIFLNEMDTVFLVNPNLWDDKTKIQACKSKLQGVARDLAYSTMTTNGSWEKFKQDMLSLFSENHIELLTLQLKNTKIHPNEETVKFYARIKTLAKTIRKLDPSFNEDRECTLILMDSVDTALWNELLKEFKTERLTSMKVMEFIKEKSVNYPTKKGTVLDSSCRESYYPESAPVSACYTRPANQSEFRESYNQPESDPLYAPYCVPEPTPVAALNTKPNYQHYNNYRDNQQSQWKKNHPTRRKKVHNT